MKKLAITILSLFSIGLAMPSAKASGCKIFVKSDSEFSLLFADDILETIENKGFELAKNPEEADYTLNLFTQKQTVGELNDLAAISLTAKLEKRDHIAIVETYNDAFYGDARLWLFKHGMGHDHDLTSVYVRAFRHLNRDIKKYMFSCNLM